MPYFYNPQDKYFICTNFKVMQSTLRRQFVLKRVRWLRVWLSRHPVYFLSRNPYARLESFFHDKLSLNVDRASYWVRSQRIFFKPLNLDKCSDNEKHDRIMALEFDEFIALLPQTYDKNRHLQPQRWLFKGLRCERMLKVECEDDKAFMASTLGLDLSIRQNWTKSSQKSANWTPKAYETVNRLYQEDFDFFDYDMKL